MAGMDNILYDAIIIGAGSVGTPIAFNLAKSGMKILVVDQLSSVGQGSNKKAIGGIRATHSDSAKIRICLRSIEIFSTWFEYNGEDIEWTKGGYCFVAYRENEEKVLKDLLKTQNRFHLNIKWYDAEDLCQIIPDLNRQGLIGGTYSPDDGNASPLLATHAFYKHARQFGAEFHFREKVTGIEIERGKIIGVHTDRGRYNANLVINAAGPWAAVVAKLAGVEIPIQPDAHEAAVTEPVAHFLDPMIVDIRPSEGSSNYYFYQHATGQVFFCITPSPNKWGFDVDETSEFLPMVSKRMIEVIPRLKNIRVRRTWRGLYPMTPDGNPIVGWSREVDGLLHVAGMCGQGFMLGPGLGELVTRMVIEKLDVEDQLTLEYFSPYRQYKGMEKLK
jgi:sarcosine oxidase, subunit beta